MPFTMKAGTAAIFKAGLIAGTLDILSAFIQFYIKTGKDPLKVLNYITKIVCENTAVAGYMSDNEIAMQAFGLVFHFCIAFAWTLFFFIILPRIKLLRYNKILSGLVYGIFVWIMMNLVCIPLYRGISYQFTNTKQTIVAILILMLAVGIPISIVLNNDYAKRKAIA